MFWIAATFWAVLVALAGLHPGVVVDGWVGWLPLLGVAMVAEAFEVGAGGGGVMSLSGAAHVAGVILFGPVVAAVIAGSAVVIVDGTRGQMPRRVVAANSAMFGWSTLAAGGVYLLLGGTTGAVTVGSAFALVGLVVARGLVNATVFAIGEALATGRALGGALRDVLTGGAETYVGEGALGVLVASGWNAEGWIVLPFLVPLFGALYSAKANLERLRTETAAALAAFARVIDERDPNTARHTERVSAYVARFVTAIELSPRKAARLVEAAGYHDLGKIGVDEATLSKAGRLNAAELRAIRRHPRLSARLLGPFGFAREIARYVELHHERFDGRGYYGVGVEEIPLEAHVLIVADCFDAMTSPRTYRPALSAEEACKELLENAGSQFHPVVARLFVAMIREQDMRMAVSSAEIEQLLSGFEVVPMPGRDRARTLLEPRLLVVLSAGTALIAASLTSNPIARTLILGGAIALCARGALTAIHEHRRVVCANRTHEAGAPPRAALAAAGIASTAFWLAWDSTLDGYTSSSNDSLTREVCSRAARVATNAAIHLEDGRYLMLGSETAAGGRLAVALTNRPSRVEERIVRRVCHTYAQRPAAIGAGYTQRATPITRDDPTVLQIRLDAFERIRRSAGQLVAQRVINDALEAVKGSVREGDVVELVGDDELLALVTLKAADEVTRLADRVQAALAGVVVPQRVLPITTTVTVAASTVAPVDPDAHAWYQGVIAPARSAVGE